MSYADMSTAEDIQRGLSRNFIKTPQSPHVALASRRRVRIRLYGTNPADLDQVAREIVDIAKKMGVEVRGPIPLPTKRLVVTVRRAPSGQGYHTFDHWELRISKRLIDIEASERVLRRLMTIRVPDTVKIELQLI